MGGTHHVRHSDSAWVPLLHHVSRRADMERDDRDHAYDQVRPGRLGGPVVDIGLVICTLSSACIRAIRASTRCQRYPVAVAGLCACPSLRPLQRLVRHCRAVFRSGVPDSLVDMAEHQGQAESEPLPRRAKDRSPSTGACCWQLDNRRHYQGRTF